MAKKSKVKKETVSHETQEAPQKQTAVDIQYMTFEEFDQLSLAERINTLFHKVYGKSIKK